MSGYWITPLPALPPACSTRRMALRAAWETVKTLPSSAVKITPLSVDVQDEPEARP